MKDNDVIGALLALGQTTRLAVYRLLVEQGSIGLSVSEISQCLDVNISTLSRHLARLEQSRLLRSWRIERQIFYATDHNGTQELLQFLTEDCCKAHPETCLEITTGHSEQ